MRNEQAISTAFQSQLDVGKPSLPTRAVHRLASAAIDRRTFLRQEDEQPNVRHGRHHDRHDDAGRQRHTRRVSGSGCWRGRGWSTSGLAGAQDAVQHAAFLDLIVCLFRDMFAHSQTLPKGGPPTLVLSCHDIRVIATLYGFLGLHAALGCGRSAPAVLACRRPPGRQLADRFAPL